MIRSKIEVMEISHFTHPGHVLSVDQSTEFTCGLCGVPSNNQPRFKCTTCPDFNLDSACANCEEVTTSFMHPDHILVLNLSLEVTTTNNKPVCAVCNQEINGGHYSCCDFLVHPVCLKFPEMVRAGASPAHEDHEMRGVISGVLTTCHACREDCTGLRYRCTEGCDVDFHPSCLAGFRNFADGGDGTVGTTRGFGRSFRFFMTTYHIWDLLGVLLSLA